MGDTLAPKGVFGAFHPPAFLVEEPQVVLHKADQPDLIADFLDADLAREVGSAGKAHSEVIPGNPSTLAKSHIADFCRDNERLALSRIPVSSRRSQAPSLYSIAYIGLCTR